jgi:hypothetical protein
MAPILYDKLLHNFVFELEHCTCSYMLNVYYVYFANHI